MDTQETKEQSLTPMQEIRHKVDKLSLSIDWLKWIVGTGLLGLAGLVTYLHSDIKQDTRQDMQRLESRIDKLDSRIDRIESSIQDIRILLIQKQSAGGQDTSPVKRQAKR